MSVLKGRQTYFAIKNEVTRGTVETTHNKLYAFNSLETDLKKEYKDVESGFGQLYKQLDKLELAKMAEGKVEMVLDADYVADFLRYIYGQATSAQDATTGAYTHTFAQLLNSVESPTFTVVHSKGDAGHKRTNGGMIDELEIDFEESGDSKLSVSFKALNEVDNGSTPTITYIKPSKILLGKSIIAKSATTIAGLSSGTAFKITKLNIKFKRNIKYDTSFNAGVNNDILSDGFECEVSFDALVRTNTFYNDFVAGTKKAYQFDCEALYLPLIGTSTTRRPRINFDIAPSVIEIKHSLPLDEFISFNATIKPELSTVDGFGIRTIVQNAIASLT